MAIKIDGNRKTYRSDVKSRSGKRLPGLEAHYQGVDFSEANINRCLLPILGRSHVGGELGHNYSQVNAVYRSVPKAGSIVTKRIIDVSVVMDPATATYNDGDPALMTSATTDFSGLVGQKFTILNPFYHIDNTTPQSWTFEFTNTVGIDPRKMCIPNGLYPGSLMATTTMDEIAKHPMNIHNPRGSFDYANQWSHNNFQQQYRSVPANQAKLDLYGAYNSTTGRYEIPMGLSPVNTFANLVNSINSQSTLPLGKFYVRDDGTITGAQYATNRDLTWQTPYHDNNWPWLLGQNPAWMYLCVSRAIYNVLPNYMTILEPTQIKLPTGVERGDSFCYWLPKNPNGTPENSWSADQRRARNNMIVKILYTGDIPSSWTGGVNQSTGADVSVTNWALGQPVEYVRTGYREIPKEKQTFYEDFRSDYLQTTNFRDFSLRTKTGVTNTSGTIDMYSPQKSKGSSFYSSGDILVAFEGVLSGTVPTAVGLEVSSELVQIHKTQNRDEIPNTAVENHAFVEDIHYIDTRATSHEGLEQTWTYMSTHWRQYVNVNDHSGDESAAFVQHMTNLMDKNYIDEIYIPDYPMSGIVDVLARNRSVYTNTPPSILERTKGASSIQYLDPDCVTITGDTWKKAVEEVGSKKYEDVRGTRRLPEPEYWIIEYKITSNPNHAGKAKVVKRFWDGTSPATPAELADHDHFKWKYAWKHPPNTVYERHGTSSSILSITHVPQLASLLSSFDIVPADGIHPAGINPDNDVMFNDYFDQQETEALDYFEIQRWTRMDSTMFDFISAQRWDHDNDGSTPTVETNRPERREWQEDEYLYANTGHTTIHSERVNGIIAQEYKR